MVESAAGDDVALSPRKQRRGIISRVLRTIFGSRSEDYEKRLQRLSKEEALLQTRMKRRALLSRKRARILIVLSVIVEVVAVAYAIIATRSLELKWQMRALRVLPMFVLPGLSSVIYSTLAGFTRMRDRKDLKTLERLRAERKAKIDELKEKTDYYTTQELIQRYDLDPTAKTAATAVLASKLGADSSLKVLLKEEPKTNKLPLKSGDAEPVQYSGGLRNRRQSHTRSDSPSNSVLPQSIKGTSSKSEVEGEESPVLTQRVVEHYLGSGLGKVGWIPRIASLLVSEDPSKSLALICGNCHMHNGLVRKADFPCVMYYCPHCHVLNRSLESVEQKSGSGSSDASTAIGTKLE